jgi:hypothetical protein
MRMSGHIRREPVHALDSHAYDFVRLVASICGHARPAMLRQQVQHRALLTFDPAKLVVVVSACVRSEALWAPGYTHGIESTQSADRHMHFHKIRVTSGR